MARKSRPGRKVLLAAATAVPFAAAAGWLAYSRLVIDHRRHLRAALPGDRQDLPSSAGQIRLYHCGANEGVPLLLLHSVNAAASAFEVKPLYQHYFPKRPMYALDLPGFGFSERRDRIYTPRTMTDAIHAVVETVRGRHSGAAVDAVALSLSCEYAARAALERPHDYRSLGLISPTGFDKALSGDGRAQANKGNRLTLSVLSVPIWSQALFDVFVSRPSMRFFLRKTFGSNNISEGLFAYDQATAHQPDARHVVWSFLAGYLFADDIIRIYRQLSLPVWAVHGRRGDFVDYHRQSDVADKPNWYFDEFDTGAFPHFERLKEVTSSYDAFIAGIAIA